MKTRFTPLDIFHLTKELNDKSSLVDSYIQNIYSADGKNFYFKLNNNLTKEKKFLHLNVGNYFYLTDSHVAGEISFFCQKMRKLLPRRRIEKLLMPSWDRVVVIELYGESGLGAKYIENVEKYLRGDELIDIKEQPKIPITKKEKGKKERIVVPAIANLQPGDIIREKRGDDNPIKYIIFEFFAGGNVLLLNKDFIIVDLYRPAKDLNIMKNERYVLTPIKITEENISLLDDKQFINSKLPLDSLMDSSSYTLYRHNVYSTYTPLSKTVIDKHGLFNAGGKDFTVMQYEQFNFLLHDFYAQSIKEKPKKKDKGVKHKKEITPEEIRRRTVESLKNLKDKREKEDGKMDMFNKHYTEIHPLFEYLRAMNKHVDLEDLIILTKEKFTVDFTYEVKIDHLLVGGKNGLFYNMTFYANINRLYMQKHKINKKIERTEEALKTKFLIPEKKVEAKKGKMKKLEGGRKLFWFEKFHFTLLNNSFIIIGGRNEEENEKIVKIYLRDDDLYAHSTETGPSCVLKRISHDEFGFLKTCKKPDPVLKHEKSELVDLIEFSNYYSKTYSSFYVKGSQVSCTKKKGLFQIAGKKETCNGGEKLSIALTYLATECILCKNKEYITKLANLKIDKETVGSYHILYNKRRKNREIFLFAGRRAQLENLDVKFIVDIFDGSRKKSVSELIGQLSKFDGKIGDDFADTVAKIIS